MKQTAAASLAGDDLEQLTRAHAESNKKIRGRFASAIAELGRKRYRCLVIEHHIGKGMPGRPRQAPIDMLFQMYTQAGGKFRARMFHLCYPGFRKLEPAEQKRISLLGKEAVRQRITYAKRKASELDCCSVS